VLSNEDLRPLVHLDDEQGQGLVLLILAPTEQDFPELLSVDGDIGFLQVNQRSLVPSLLPLPRVDLREESGSTSSG